MATQSFSSHARWFPPFHFVVLPILLANFLVALRHAYFVTTRGNIFAVLVALGLFMLAATTRTMVMAVQDRVIRLEMQLRLRGVLPAPLSGRVGDLTAKQLIALRFASDAELADLVRDVLDGKIASQKDIKSRVKDWQADLMRA